MIEKTFIETDMQYHNGVCMEEYREEIGICRANRGKDEKVYTKWGFPQGLERQPTDKAIPWKVTLGSRSQAIQILESFLEELKNESNSEQPEKDSESVIFLSKKEDNA